MRIALAQIQSHPGDVPANLDIHIEQISQAVQRGAEAIFFPELSLTGYEPGLAEALAFSGEEEIWRTLQEVAEKYDVLVGVGAPIWANTGIQIAMLVFHPGAGRQIYAKQWLHEDERPYFVAGQDPRCLEFRGVRISLAICYESLRPEHLQQSLNFQPDIYLASVAKPQHGLNKAFQYFPETARQHQLPILMVNGVGPADNFISAGQSAAWNSDGKLVKCLEGEEEELLFVDL